MSDDMWLAYLADILDMLPRNEHGCVSVGDPDEISDNLRRIAARMRGPHWHDALKAELDDAMKQPK